jgi:hypothetical protein
VLATIAAKENADQNLQDERMSRIIFLAKTQKRFSLAKAVISSPVSGEAGRGNRYVCTYSHFSFPQKRKKSFLAK